jgi:hypothetical protein
MGNCIPKTFKLNSGGKFNTKYKRDVKLKTLNNKNEIGLFLFFTSLV